MNWLNIVAQFIISGSIVVGATLLAKHIDAKWSGLLVALPIMTILGFIFIASSSSQIVTQRYLLSALMFMIPAAIYILSLYLLVGRTNRVTSCILSLIPLAIAVMLVQKIF